MRELALLLLLAPLSHAGTLVIDYQLPTEGCVSGSVPVKCGLPLTGADKLISVHVFISRNPIPDDSPMRYRFIMPPNYSRAQYTHQDTPGTIYYRLKARTACCLSAFSEQGTKVIP